MTDAPGPVADIAVIGGSGFYSFLTDVERYPVETPYGPPSDDIAVGEIDGRRVAFLARHGQGHRFSAHEVPYRANLWALRSLGVRQVLAPCAVGSLVPEHGPGTLVVPDQVIDRTWGRAHTVYADAGAAVHVGFADPYCPTSRAAMVDGASRVGLSAVAQGTLVVINGPRFSTRAESRWHRSIGGTVVGMTGMPEASIARELALCYSTACLVTDHDAGVEGQEPVSHEAVLAEFARSIDALKAAVRTTICALPAPEPDDTATCSCRRALDGVTVPFPLP
ncbi:S-methyl-5'-thioadenosine phosphorylase [Demetria terragena]|uniref:S-methyl-5'-thioadenosine phosphorylase n=1 Tax=Demetria terragena TaxID=63959 RepID=UPI0004768E89|nr:S-methyl-5'-thioadenosine phosphorylase [Demetria terragena]